MVPGSSNAQISVLAITSQGQLPPVRHPAGRPARRLRVLRPAALRWAARPPPSSSRPTSLSPPPCWCPATAWAHSPRPPRPSASRPSWPATPPAPGSSTTVVLSAPAGPARVRLTELTSPAGTPGRAAASSQQVTVPACRTLAVPASRREGAGPGSAFAVVITPLAGSGPALRRAGGRPQGQGSRRVHHPGRQRPDHDQPAPGPGLLRRHLALTGPAPASRRAPAQERTSVSGCFMIMGQFWAKCFQNPFWPLSWSTPVMPQCEVET